MMDKIPALSRRHALAGGLAALAAASARPLHAAPAVPISATLGELAAAKGLHFGASFSTGELDQPYGPRYAALYRRETRVLTSELELKLSVLAPGKGTLDFGPADRLVRFAQDAGQEVRGHTLIWNDDVPTWIGQLTRAQVTNLIDTHIAAVMSRYKGRIRSYDVVNEPIAPWDRQPGNLRRGPFLDALGVGYIARSFKAARKTDPTAQLVLNEAQTESSDENGQVFRDSFLALVRQLTAEGAEIDAIGLQCHLDSARPYDFPRFAAFVEDLAALGYDILITELDVNDRAFPGDVKTRDRLVAQLYSEFLSAVLAIRAVKTLTTWQLADHTSWITYQAAIQAPSARRRPRPLLFDENFEPKPARHAVAEALAQMPAR